MRQSPKVAGGMASQALRGGRTCAPSQDVDEHRDRNRLHEVTQPVLLVHGDLDAVVSRAQVDALAASLDRAARLERLDLPASAHLVGIDYDRELLHQRVATFLDSLENGVGDLFGI